jgi:cysteine synthase
MDSDLAATSGMVAQAAGRISELTMPPETKSERVKVAEFFGGPIEKPEDVDQAVELLRQRLLGLLERGNRIIIE